MIASIAMGLFSAYGISSLFLAPPPLATTDQSPQGTPQDPPSTISIYLVSIGTVSSDYL